MQLVFGKSKWEMWGDPLTAFLQRVRDSGFAATEIYLNALAEPPAEIARQHVAYGLRLIGQVITQGQTPREHGQSLEQQLALAVQCQAIFVNCHLGRDFFRFEDNVRLFQRAVELSRSQGLPLYVETHRGRPTYSAIETRRYLEAVPELRLTADFSHWMVVHEADLADQPENVDLAISRSAYIHARVGYEEGPQVPDPRAPEWQPTVEAHVRLWQRIVASQRRAGSDRLFITPEFGPPNYMHTLPFTNQPVADVWELNVYMKNMLAQTLQV